MLLPNSSAVSPRASGAIKLAVHPMTNWLAILCIAAAVAASTFTLHTGPTPGTDKGQTPAEQVDVMLPLPPGSVVALADLHGDLAKGLAALQLLQLVDGSGTWVAHNVTLVQLGDLVDRGRHSLQLLQLMKAVQRQAPDRGSQVQLLLGNHELMLLQQDMRYFSQDELLQLGQAAAQQQQQQALGQQPAATGANSNTEQNQQAGQPDAKSMRRLHDGSNSIPRVGDSSVPFVQQLEHQQRGLSAAESAGNAAPGSQGTRQHQAAGLAALQRLLQPQEGALWQDLVGRQLLAVAGHGSCSTAFVHAGLTKKLLRSLLELAAADAQLETGQPHHNQQQQQTGVLHWSSVARLNGAAQQALAQCTPAGCSSSAHDTTAPNQHKQHGRIHATHAPLSSDSHTAAASLAAQQDGPQPEEHQRQPQQQLSQQQLEALWRAMSSSRGPVWTRHLAKGAESEVCTEVTKLCRALGVHRLVVGHTPQDSGRAAVRCRGRLLLLDTGMSVGIYNSQPAAFVCSSGPGDLKGVVGSRGRSSSGTEDSNSNSIDSSSGSGQADSAAKVGCTAAVVYQDGTQQVLPCSL